MKEKLVVNWYTQNKQRVKWRPL